MLEFYDNPEFPYIDSLRFLLFVYWREGEDMGSRVNQRMALGCLGYYLMTGD
jgi:hypothetical protein